MITCSSCSCIYTCSKISPIQNPCQYRLKCTLDKKCTFVKQIHKIPQNPTVKRSILSPWETFHFKKIFPQKQIFFTLIYYSIIYYNILHVWKTKGDDLFQFSSNSDSVLNVYVQLVTKICHIFIWLLPFFSSLSPGTLKG